MTDEEIIKNTFLECANELPFKKYLAHSSESMNLNLSFAGKTMDESDKKIRNFVTALNNWHTDVMIITIAKLKERGFFK